MKQLFDPAKIKPLLEAYDARLEALQELLTVLEAAGLITLKRREVAKARALAQKHLAEIDAGMFASKQESALIRQIDDTMEISAFDLDSAFENPRGSAIGIMTAVGKAYDALQSYVFAEPDDGE